MSNRLSKKIAAASFALLAAAHLSGCGGDDSAPASNGGGGSGGGGGGGGGSTGSATGVFVDSPVQGLSYTTSPSNITGTTNASGQYTYNPGDTVTFALGDLVLGSVPAQETVTPLTVAQALIAANPSADVEAITVNILTFLQSLDSDGNAENGITIATSVADVMASNAISFTAAPSAFETALNSLVASVESATGTDLTVVDREDAEEHFVGQQPTLLAGTYVWSSEDGVAVTQNTRTLTLFENGTYVYGGHDNDPNCNGQGNYEDADGNGVEMGTFEFNPLTRLLGFHKTFETNGGCGPDSAENYTLNIDGNVLHIDDGSEESHWVAVTSTNGQVAGSWSIPSSMLSGRPLVVTFFPGATAGSGRYFLVDTMLATPDAINDTSSGIEEGCYTVDGNGAFAVDLDEGSCAGAIDTNDTAGLSNNSSPFVVEVDAHGRFRINEGSLDAEGVTEFVRLPLQSIATADRVGTWYIDNAGLAPQDDPNLFVASFFANGKYILGGVHDDNACDEALSYQDAGGNGAEFGTLTDVQNGMHGAVTAAATVDSNGSCGFYNESQTAAQRYMFVRSQQDDALLVFPFDEEFAVVMKRVPSYADSIVGAWLMDGLEEDHPHLGVFLPDGVMFEISAADGDESGLWRSEYEVNANGDQFTLTSGGENCVDTMGFDSCGTPEEEVLDFELTGTSMHFGDGVEDYAYTKITTP